MNMNILNVRVMRCRALLVLAICGGLTAGCEPSSKVRSIPLQFGANNPNVVVAMGDSVTDGSAINGKSYPQIVAELSGKTVINEGVGGAFSSDGVRRIGAILEREKPGFIFILYGINDVIHVGRNERTIENLRQMIQLARQNQTHPIVGTITPRFRWNGANSHAGLNRRIRELCVEEDVILADVEKEFGDNQALFWPDLIHPNEDGNLLCVLRLG